MGDPGAGGGGGGGGGGQAAGGQGPAAGGGGALEESETWALSVTGGEGGGCSGEAAIAGGGSAGEAAMAGGSDGGDQADAGVGAAARPMAVIEPVISSHVSGMSSTSRTNLTPTCVRSRRGCPPVPVENEPEKEPSPLPPARSKTFSPMCAPPLMMRTKGSPWRSPSSPGTICVGDMAKEGSWMLMWMPGTAFRRSLSPTSVRLLEDMCGRMLPQPSGRGGHDWAETMSRVPWRRGGSVCSTSSTTTSSSPRRMPVTSI
mmetsp:Transcript_15998/g.43130  ORF Transcript_15998/g.43130 Transcript_15998/m.43130 type:complete len:259 (+) Transcript_15998:3297-4073(+)